MATDSIVPPHCRVGLRPHPERSRPRASCAQSSLQSWLLADCLNSISCDVVARPTSEENASDLVHAILTRHWLAVERLTDGACPYFGAN